MLWNLHFAPSATPQPDAPADGRFVLQRHHDLAGPHLDLRLEQPGGFLLGWRIDANTPEGDTIATEKSPHPIAWLDHDGDTVREDAGTYQWLDRDDTGGRLLLRGARAQRIVTIARGETLPAAALRDLHQAASRLNLRLADVPRLLEDGVTARQRATERFCGLGRELDGTAFDETLWRETLRGLSLGELQAHLRAFERRFDAKYPPQPVSRPAALDAEATPPAARTLALLRE